MPAGGRPRPPPPPAIPARMVGLVALFRDSLQKWVTKSEKLATLGGQVLLMQGKSQDIWPDVFVSTAQTAAAVSRAVKAGKLRKLASRLYTRNLTDPSEQIVRRNLWQIVGGYFQGALVTDRTGH